MLLSRSHRRSRPLSTPPRPEKMTVGFSLPLLLPRSTGAVWFNGVFDEEAALDEGEKAHEAMLLGIRNFNSDLPIVGREGRSSTGGGVVDDETAVDPDEDDPDDEDDDGEEEMDDEMQDETEEDFDGETTEPEY